ncbi:MAG: hypothetical protein SGPRY_007892 [Prymnesium sp.]
MTASPTPRSLASEPLRAAQQGGGPRPPRTARRLCCPCFDSLAVDDHTASKRYAHFDGAQEERDDRLDVEPGAPGDQLRVDQFELLSLLGRGNYGKQVLLVKKKSSGQYFAMKALEKAETLKRNQLRHTLTEWAVLRNMAHPFIVKMHFAFQDERNLYLVSYSILRCTLPSFAPPELHAQDIVYRDLKPENVLIDDRGHAVLSDFGLAKEAITSLQGGTWSFCGTPSYMAPEVLQGSGHGVAVDWWCFGTLIFEMLVGTPPFYSYNLQTMYRAILHAPLRFPKSMGKAARALLVGLLCRQRAHRPVESFGKQEQCEANAKTSFLQITRLQKSVSAWI